MHYYCDIVVSDDPVKKMAHLWNNRGAGFWVPEDMA